MSLAEELECRATLWNLLCSRRDIDSVTLELLGRHYADQNQPGGPVSVDDSSAFNLACSLEMVFDLQRTHLQSHPPRDTYRQPANLGPRTVADRSPCLLSLKTAKDAFACLSTQAMRYLEMSSSTQDDKTSFRRMVVVRTLVSGTRMLCLHPDIEPGSTPLAPPLASLSLTIGPQCSFWEQILFRACKWALGGVPGRPQGLPLPQTIFGRNKSPLDGERLFRAAKKYIEGFFVDPHNKYWPLYDICWSIVATFTQCLAAKGDFKAQGLGSLAADIANEAMKEACKVPKDAETCVLLLDIVEVLRPVLLYGWGRDGAWRASYNSILGEIFPGRTPIFIVYRACVSEEIIALKRVERALKQRQSVLRDSDGELSAFLSHLEDAYTAALSEHNGCPPRHVVPDGGQEEALKFYFINCNSGHIVADNDVMFDRLLDGRIHSYSQSQGSYTVEPTHCPFCPPNSAYTDSAFTRLHENLPLNSMLELVSRKRKELEEYGIQQIDFFSPPERGAPAPMMGDPDPPRQVPPYTSRDPLPWYGLRIIPHKLQRSPSSSRDSSNAPEVVPQAVQDMPSPAFEPPSSIMTSPANPISPVSPVGPLSPLGRTGKFPGRQLMKKLTFSGKGPAAESARRASTTESSSGSNVLPIACDKTISLEQLGQGRKSVALSPDFERIVFWTRKNLAFCGVSDVRMNLVPMEGTDLVITSRNYCVILRQHSDHDEIRWYGFGQGFDQPIRTLSFKHKSMPDVVQCLAMSPDDTHLAIGLKGGVVQLFQPEQCTNPQILNFEVNNCNSLAVASLSFTADSGELVVSIRAGSSIIVFTSPKPFIRSSPFYKYDIGSQENDNQGISALIRSPDRDLICATHWTIHGVSFLRDCSKGVNKYLKKSELIGDVNINNRIQQAAFSKSGRILILVDAAGNVFKIFPDSIDHVRVEFVTGSIRLRWKAQSIGNHQLLDMKIADDEEQLRVIWIDEKKNQAQIVTVPAGASG